MQIEVRDNASRLNVDDLQNRCPHQKRLHLVVEVPNDLFGQKVEEDAVRAGQTADEATDLSFASALKVCPDERKRCHPALSPSLEVIKNALIQRQTVAIPEESFHLIVTEAEITPRQFRLLAESPEAC